MNWTKSRKQWTVPVAGRFYLLGTDRVEAERLYRSLLTKHDLDEPVGTNPTFASVCDQRLEHVKKNRAPDRLPALQGPDRGVRPPRQLGQEGP